MKIGKFTQTVWRRSVGKQLHKIPGPGGSVPHPFEACAKLQTGGEDPAVWADASAEGGVSCARYAVLRAAGELASQGISADTVSIRLMLPPDTEEEELQRIAASADELCVQMDLRIASFQGEVTAAVCCPAAYAAAGGTKRRGRTGEKNTGGGKTDPQTEREILLCGCAGLEGTLRILELAEEELSARFVPAFLEQTEELKNRLVIPDRLLDVTDRILLPGAAEAVRQVGSGGILAALWELAELLDTGFEIDLSAVPLRQETVEICEFYRLNPYQLTSAGSFLIVSRQAGALIRELEKEGIRAGRLGVARAQNARVITSGDETRYLDRPAPDELSRWMAERRRTGSFGQNI